MIFQPIADYHSYNHILQAGAHWVHPGNGATYCCACEQKAGAQQNLCVYRMRPGASSWELVRRYRGTIDSAGHITMGGASIEQNGDMLVTTSLIIPGAEKVTSTGFQGCWIREANIDEPWRSDSTLAARVAALEGRIAALTAGVPALVSPLQLPAQLPPQEGAEIQLADGSGGHPWCIDVYQGVLRLHKAGKVVQEWRA